MPEQTLKIAVSANGETSPGRAAARFIHVANLLTYISFFSGVASIVVAHELGTSSIPSALLAIGVLADIFDGKFARLFARPIDLKAFGAQIDSLSDAIVFGAAPVLVLYLTGAAPNGVNALYWGLAAALYLICAITRLGAYNLTESDAQGFVGLPAPLAALILATSMLTTTSSFSNGLLLFACGVAMVSPLRIARPGTFGLSLLVLWTLTVVAVGFVGSP